MQVILAYTIEHTGGVFTGGIFKNGFSSKKFSWLGDIHFIARGRSTRLDTQPCSEITKDWIDKFALQYLTEEEQNKDIVIIHGHHNVPSSQVMKSILNSNTYIPIIAPMRDPLLVINTTMWRSFLTTGVTLKEESSFTRSQRTKRIVALINNILSVDSNNLFLYPVDIPDMLNESYRFKYTNKMMQFCNIPFTDEAKQFVADWKSIGTTKDSIHMKQYKIDQKFLEYKNIILSGNKTKINKILTLEYEYLKQQENLKYKLERIGYRNLSWW